MKYRYGIILLFIALALLGLLVLPRVPLKFSSDQGSNALNISYYCPQAAPEALERQVTAPLEGVLGTIQGVAHIKSASGYNSGAVALELDQTVDPDKVRFEAASVVRQIYRNFPQGVSYPVISLASTEQKEAKRPLISLQVNAKDSPGALTKYIEETLKPRLAKVNGISAVEVNGGNPQEWLIQYNPLVLRSLNISESDLTAAIGKANEQHGLGWINTSSGFRESVALAPHSISASNFLDIPIAKKGPRIVRIRDVATIQKREKPALTFFRINGKDAVQVALTAQSDVNQLSVASESRKIINTLRKELPDSYGLRIDYDATDYYYEIIAKFRQQAATALLLVLLLALSIFRHWKAMLISGLSVTINSLLASLVFFLAKTDIQLSSLTAIIIANGLVTGNIWITYYHYTRSGDRSVIKLLLCVNLIMLVAFSVIRFMPLQMQSQLFGLAVPFITLHVLSLATCGWLVPSMIDQLNVPRKLPPRIKRASWAKVSALYWTILQWTNRFRLQSALFILVLFGTPFFQLPQRLEGNTKVAVFYNKTIGSEWFSENGRSYLNRAVGGFLRLFVNYVYDKSSYSSGEETLLFIRAGLPNRSTVEQMNEVLDKMESQLGKHIEIDRYVSQVSNGQNGSILVYFKDEYKLGYFPFQLKSKMITLSTEMSDVDWDIYGVGQGYNVNPNANSSPNFVVTLKGYNYKDLEQVATVLKKKLLAHPRIQEVNINKETGQQRHKDLFAYRFSMDDYYWGSNGITKEVLYDRVHAFSARTQPDLYQLIDDSYEGIDVQPASLKSFDLTALLAEPIVNHGQSGLKLRKYSNLAREEIMPTIRKEDQEYVRLVSFDYMGSVAFGEKFLNKTLLEFEQSLPMGYSAEAQSHSWWKVEARRQYELIALAFVLIFIICSVFLESLRQPLVLIVAILVSYIGLFIAFYISDIGFDQGGYASFLVATGITSLPFLKVINSWKVHLTNEKEDGLKSYFETIYREMKGIVLFNFSAVLSLLIVLFWGPDQAFWSAFAVGTIGGLCGSLITVCFFVPIFLISRSKS